MLEIYNRLNIILRKIISCFSRKKEKLPLLHCSFKKILEKNFLKDSQFYFVQVGAFDGISHDILFDFVKQRMAKGIVIEPLADHFETLQKNYSFNKKIIAIKSAVHNSLKDISLYRVGARYADQLPDWAAGISSIDPLHHLKTNIPSEMIEEIRVEARPLMELVNQHFTEKKIHLLQTDTEGYDYEIIKTFDFHKFTPDIIKLEYINLSHKNVNDSIQLLRSNNYYCLYDEGDIIGIQLNKIRL